jgi:hypothetical protein
VDFPLIFGPTAKGDFGKANVMRGNKLCTKGLRAVPEFIDPVFTKTSPKLSFSLNRKRAFWLVFAKTGSIISGTGVYKEMSSILADK